MVETDTFHIFDLFKRINETIEKKANSDLQSNDITLSQLKMLFTVSKKGNYPEKGCMPLKELERRFGVAQSTAAGIIQRLEKKGLVESFADAEDKRVKLLRVTEKGKNICESAEKSMDEFTENAVRSLTEEEKNCLMSLLQRILNNFE